MNNINTLYRNYRITDSITMMALGFVIISSIGLYLDNVLPGGYG